MIGKNKKYEKNEWETYKNYQCVREERTKQTNERPSESSELPKQRSNDYSRDCWWVFGDVGYGQRIHPLGNQEGIVWSLQGEERKSRKKEGR